MIELFIVWALFSFQMSGERDRCLTSETSINNKVPANKCAVECKECIR
jgi:hypothetical protein